MNSEEITGIAKLYPFDKSKEYFFGEGCHIVEVLNSESSEDLSVARARLEPGETTRWHTLEGVSERYLITEGQGVVELGDGVCEVVKPGDVVNIPPGCKQRIRNSGGGDLIFFAICTPRFREACYRDVDND
ncbi:MAG: cupin domain-containing protein [Agarilytica sp.]